MAAPARSLEAKAARGQDESVSKPWLQNAAPAAMRAAENPSSMRHHLKTIAEKNNKHFGEAWESSRKSTQVIFATLHAEDDKAYKQSGKAKFAQENPKLQFMSRMDYKKFIETALDESREALNSSPSWTMQDMRKAVESKVAWLPKLEDLYRSESQQSLPGDHLVNRVMTVAAPPLDNNPGASSSDLSVPKRGAWNKIRQHTQTQSAINAFGKSTHSSSKRLLGPKGGNTAAACASSNAPAAAAGATVRTASPAAAVMLPPWENSALIARHGVRHDALHSRLQRLDRRIARRRVAEQAPDDSRGSWVKQAPQLAAVGPIVTALANGDPLHGGERVQIPTDAVLLAMEPVDSLRVLRECELRTLSLLTGVKQTWRERVTQSKGRRVVLLQGGDGIHQDDNLRSRYNSYLLEVMETLTVKRRLVVRHVVSKMDNVSKVVGKEVAGVMMRKKKMDADEAGLRQTLRRQDEEDVALGRGYVAVRFSDRPSTCPAG
eukprot:jgi/Ulvmu1/4312/UM002_0033.1